MLDRLLTAAAVCVLGLTVVAAAQDEKPATPQDTPRSQIDELEREFDDAMRAFEEKARGAKSNRELQALHRTEMPDRAAYAKRFMEIARRDPDDPDVCDAFNWVVNHSTVHVRSLADAAVAQLQRHHVTNPRIVGAVGVLSYHGEPGRKLLQDVLEKNPDHACQGMALYTLADWKRYDADTARDMLASPRFLALAWLFSPGEISRMSDQRKLKDEAVAMFERVVREYSDVRYAYSDDRTVGDLAKRALFEIRHLSVGGTAPEIEGEDIDGKPLKLSDFRGKVVVLVFWGDWSPVSESIYPGLKALVEQFKDKPVVVLGVNSDEDRARMRARVDELKIHWRSWFDGGTEGPIAKEWGIEELDIWTCYVIDADGVIRLKPYEGFSRQALTTAIEKLLSAQE